MGTRISQRFDQVSTGDVESVTAGSGLSGGGTSGALTIDLDVSDLTALGATAATTDYLAVYDTDASSTKKVLVSNMPALWG
jgi:hypothetical protein